ASAEVRAQAARRPAFTAEALFERLAQIRRETVIGWAAAAVAGLLALAFRGAADAVLAVSLVLLAACAVVDFRTRRIPNAFTYPGLALVLLSVLLLPNGDSSSAAAGAIAGFVVFLF